MYEQQLPGFITNFKDASWQIRESEHYVFHYFKSSLAEREIERIIETQEAAYRDISTFLEVQPPEAKISYYLYPDEETKKRLMGTPWFAQSIYNDLAIHALYTEQDRVIGPHEDAHLLSLPLGLSIGFLQEGLAEYLVGHDWCGNDFHQVVCAALKDRNFKISRKLPISHSAWLDTDDAYARQYYALAALFTQYLIERFGKDKYLSLYRNLARGASDEKNAKIWQTTLGESAKNVLDNFLQGTDSRQATASASG